MKNNIQTFQLYWIKFKLKFFKKMKFIRFNDKFRKDLHEQV